MREVWEDLKETTSYLFNLFLILIGLFFFFMLAFSFILNFHDTLVLVGEILLGIVGVFSIGIFFFSIRQMYIKWIYSVLFGTLPYFKRFYIFHTVCEIIAITFLIVYF